MYNSFPVDTAIIVDMPLADGVVQFPFCSGILLGTGVGGEMRTTIVATRTIVQLGNTRNNGKTNMKRDNESKKGGGF